MKPDHPPLLPTVSSKFLSTKLEVILANWFNVHSTTGQLAQVQALFRVAGLGINEY